MVLKDLKMTRIGRRLIEDFLLPALNDEKYGDLLKWIDKEKCYFSIRWSHKNAAKWTLADTAVFQDWDKLKGHYHPEIKGYYMQAKQRFRAALYKLNTVRKLPCEDKHVKKYQLVLNLERRHHEIMPRKISTSRMSVYSHREDNQKSIPTSVICRHTSIIAKTEENFAEESSSSSSPSSPACSIKSESSEEKVEIHKCLEEYQRACKSQQMQKSIGGYARPIPGLRNYSDCPSILREYPQLNMVQRTPHVPIQPVPVYNNKCNFRQTVENSQKRVESPHVLLVRTYNDSDMDVDTVQSKIEIKGVKSEVTEEYNYIGSVENARNCENSEVALNLSTKSDDSETLSR